jgi:putative phosphoesterase
MRIGLISDIHGNDTALQAVLSDMARRGVDQVACLGDVATLGPSPAETIERVQGLQCPCVLGNHDDFLIAPELIHTYTKIPVILDSVAWCREQLAEAALQFVWGFQPNARVALPGGETLLLCHGSPRSHMDNLLAETPPQELDAKLDGTRVAVLAAGHTHLQMLRQHRGMLIVNPGSVGMPFQEFVGGETPTVLPHAEYAVVAADQSGVSVGLYRVDYDLQRLLDVVEASDLPLREVMLQQYGAMLKAKQAARTSREAARSA